MKKLYIVMAVALCAVFTADAKPKRRGCRGGMCGVQRTAPRATKPTAAAATAWIAPKVNQGVESAQKIAFDIQESVMKLEAELKRLKDQLAQLEAKDATEEAMMPVRNKIKVVEEELNKLKKIQNCAQ